jgi:hypothetical protein
MLTACSGDSPTPADVEESINGSIKPGATVQDIRNYLNSDGSRLGLSDPDPTVRMARDFETVLVQKRGLDPQTPIYIAIVREDRRQLTVAFVLDQALHFQRLIVIEYPLGL